MRVAVAGARGQLGAAIVRAFGAAHEVAALDRAALDLTDDRAVYASMARLAPDAIVNCAGYNDVDGAEDHAVEALGANAFAVRALARAAAACGAALVQFSSDFVFDGAASRPYTEEDAPNPRSTYAASKLAGEWFAAGAPRAYVVRVESLFGGGGPPRGSAAAILARLATGEEVRVFTDRTVSPTYAADAAAATRALLERALPGGTYHCVNAGQCTWYEFAEEAARLLGVEPRLVPITLEGVTLRAERPKFCALSCEKLRRAGIEMPAWQDALRRHLAHSRNGTAA